MKTSILSLLAALAVSLPLHAADTDTPKPEPKKDAVIESARGAIAQKDWMQAQRILESAISRNSANADYHNLYAYSIRKGANPDMSLVFKHYNEALRLDPQHRGAHEYIGEAYLMVGNLPKAKEHLSSLDKLCFFPCTEFNELKKAVSEYEAKPK